MAVRNQRFYLGVIEQVHQKLLGRAEKLATLISEVFIYLVVLLQVILHQKL